MDDKLNALDKLIEAVEAGTDIGFRFWFESDDALPELSHRMLSDSAYNGSLDAALALHEALLPGWRWSKSALGRFSVFQDRGEWFSADSQPTPARSWLLAILRAYRSIQAVA